MARSSILLIMGHNKDVPDTGPRPYVSSHLLNFSHSTPRWTLPGPVSSGLSRLHMLLLVPWDKFLPQLSLANSYSSSRANLKPPLGSLSQLLQTLKPLSSTRLSTIHTFSWDSPHLGALISLLSLSLTLDSEFFDEKTISHPSLHSPHLIKHPKCSRHLILFDGWETE